MTSSKGRTRLVRQYHKSSDCYIDHARIRISNFLQVAHLHFYIAI